MLLHDLHDFILYSESYDITTELFANNEAQKGGEGGDIFSKYIHVNCVEAIYLNVQKGTSVNSFISCGITRKFNYI